MIPFTWSRGMFSVPLKFMCSTQCDTPVSPSRSSREPTLYQHHTEASGAVCSSRTRTFRPLSSVVSRIRFIIKLSDTHAGVEGYRQPAADRLPDEGQPADGRAGMARALAGNGPLRDDRGASQGRAEVRAARRPAVRERTDSPR